MSFVLWTATPQGNAQEAQTITGGGTTTSTATGSTSTTSPAPATGGCPKADPNLWPFGVVRGRDFNVPSPPQSPSLVPTIATKTTTRIWGTDPSRRPSRRHAGGGPDHRGQPSVEAHAPFLVSVTAPRGLDVPTLTMGITPDLPGGIEYPATSCRARGRRPASLPTRLRRIRPR
jgi:hypothetical protein